MYVPLEGRQQGDQQQNDQTVLPHEHRPVMQPEPGRCEDRSLLSCADDVNQTVQLQS